MNGSDVIKLRLYVAGDAPNSTQARANLQAICRTYLAGRHELEIVDVLQEPQRGLADGILMTPALVRLGPNPVRVTGTLSQLGPIVQALGLDPVAA